MNSKQIIINSDNTHFISVFNSKIVTPLNITNKKIEPCLKVPLYCQKRVNNLLSVIPQFLKYEIDGSKMISIDVLSSIFKDEDKQSINGIIQYEYQNEKPNVNAIFKQLENNSKIKLKKTHQNENFKAEEEKKKIFFVTLDIGFIVCIIKKNYKKLILTLSNTDIGCIGRITNYKPIRQLMNLQYAFQEIDINFTIYNNYIDIYSSYLKYDNLINYHKNFKLPVLNLEIKESNFSSLITHDIIM